MKQNNDMKDAIENTKEQNEDRINRYLFSKMSKEEELEFEKELKTDELLRKQAEAVAQLIQAMKVVGKEKDARFISEIKDNQKSVMPLRSIWYSVAACIVALFMIGGGYYYYDYRHITGLGHEYAITFPDGGIIRGETDNETEKELNQLFEKVSLAEDLTSTITQLTRLWQASREDTFNEYTTYSSYIGWNLALAHLMNNDKKSAVVVLEELEKECPEGTAMGDKVRELRSKL